MKKGWISLLLLLMLWIPTEAQEIFSLEQCRELAIGNNKQLKINTEKVKQAEAEKKAAFTQFLPDFSLTGAYLYNSKDISLLSENKYLPVGTMQENGSLGFDGKTYAVIPKDAFEFDIQNVFVGTATVTQPLFMGGKIIAYNKITDYATELAESVQQTDRQKIIIEVDEAYWQCVSLSNKLNLTDNLVELLKQMNRDVEAMITEGVATKADGLSVKVKLNEAEMDQTKAANGLQLSKMLLAQLCGIPMGKEMRLADEDSENIQTSPLLTEANVFLAYANRTELKSLDIVQKIYQKKEAVVRADMLPTVALTGNYMVSNPNSFNGVEHKFGGMWNVGVMVRVPVFHWGETAHKLKAAKAETRIREIEIEEAKEKIELEVNSNAFKVNEAYKRLTAAMKNKENAEENLRYATLGFKEGVISATNVMEAQTAWYKAHSELIDAQIDTRLSQLKLTKSLGNLEVK